jgi:hypothetical protein
VRSSGYRVKAGHTARLSVFASKNIGKTLVSTAALAEQMFVETRCPAGPSDLPDRLT